MRNTVGAPNMHKVNFESDYSSIEIILVKKVLIFTLKNRKKFIKNYVNAWEGALMTGKASVSEVCFKLLRCRFCRFLMIFGSTLAASTLVILLLTIFYSYEPNLCHVPLVFL